MLKKLSQLFQSKQPDPKEEFCRINALEFDTEKGIVFQKIELSKYQENLTYLSNRRVSDFNDIAKVYDAAMIIQEKIDLELAAGRYVARLGHDEHTLRFLKAAVETLSLYYRQFVRDVKK